ncbi:MAG: ABC transporter ATP-binding protein [Planctomycetota bacterium]
MTSTRPPLLEIEGLTVSFPARGRSGQRTVAADSVGYAIYPDQTLAVVGESGSGKSVSAMSVLQLIPVPPGRYDEGKILWRPSADEAPYNLLSFSDRQMRDVRGNQIAMIFQEPMTSLNPVYTVGDQITEAIRLHQAVGNREARAIAESALRDVGIAAPAQRLREYPHQLSGGMRQRVMIAMALACEPRLLLADEPTTALDVTIQAQILELLRRLQEEKHMAVMLITHDLGVVAENADVVAVMYAGRIVEFAAVETLFARPLHPYTRGLLASMPVLGQHAERLPTVDKAANVPEDLPAGVKVAAHETMKPGVRYGGDGAALRMVEENHWLLCETIEGFVPSGGKAEAAGALPGLDYRRVLVGA